jgi:hypothetical protein
MKKGNREVAFLVLGEISLNAIHLNTVRPEVSKGSLRSMKPFDTSG